MITDEMITYVAALAKLELAEDEKEAVKKDLDEILSYISTMDELDTTGVEPMTHVFPIENRFREDVVTNGDGREESLANAPKSKDGQYIVPKTV